MKKSKLNANVAAVKKETHDALTLLCAALPPGQQRTVLKNAEIKALLERYEVEYDD